MTNLEDVAESPALVLPIYVLVLIPLGLYVYHDIVDKRWRTIRRIKPFLVGYLLLYIFTAAALVAYILIQAKASDFKEVGAAILALVVGSHKLWTLIRLIFIIRAHRQIVELMTECEEALQKLLHRQVSDVQHVDNPGYSSWIKGIAKKVKDLFHLEVSEGQGDIPRSSRISSSVFDDDYPGDSSRIKWIAKKVTVHPDDQNEFVARLAIWMRLAFFPHQNSIWDLLRNLHPGGKGARLNRSLANALICAASNRRKIPAGMSNVHLQNPAEVLLNEKDLVKYLKKQNMSEQDASQIRLDIWRWANREGALDGSARKLAKLGAAFFWSVMGLREEEVSQIIADMPAAWLVDTSLSGKELIIDLAIIMMLVDVSPCAHSFDNSLNEIVGLKSSEIKNETLVHMRDDWGDRWGGIFKVCGESVASLMTAVEDCDKEKTRIRGETETYMKDLVTIVGKEEKLGTARLRAHLIYMVREAYYAACVTLNVFGRDLVDEDVKELYQADVVLGLFSLLVFMGKCVEDEVLMPPKGVSIPQKEIPWQGYVDSFFFFNNALLEFIQAAKMAAKKVYTALNDIASEVNEADRSEKTQRTLRSGAGSLYGRERAGSIRRRRAEHTLMLSELQRYQTWKKKCDSTWELSWLDPATEPATPSPENRITVTERR